MELVIKSNTGSDVTTSFIVAETFGKRHDSVLRDIKNLECSTEFSIHNFVETPYVHPQNGQVYKMYQMTKDGFSFLVMGYTGEKSAEFKEKFITEFNKRESLLKNDDYILQRSQEILHRRVSLMEAQLNQKDQIIQLQAPKVIFADAVSASKNSILIGELAKLLKQNGVEIGQNRLFDWLRDNGYLIKRNGTDFNMPTQKSMDLGLFEIKEGSFAHADGHTTITKTPKVTGKGQVYFINKFLNQN